MDFLYTRHPQRYEYAVEKGYVTNKVVADLGCGVGFGTFLLSSVAKYIYAVDLTAGTDIHVGFNGNARKERVVFVYGDLFDFSRKVDVCTLVEVFEHVHPELLVSHVSKLCDYAFFTTPLAKVTGRTRNTEHFAEYSSSDFDRILKTRFNIIEKVYQHSDLSITTKAKPSGDSIDNSHVVQMAWCRSKHGK